MFPYIGINNPNLLKSENMGEHMYLSEENEPLIFDYVNILIWLFM